MIIGHRTSSLRHGPAQDGGRDHNLRDITDTDHAIFAIYQPSNGAPYDLANPFDRTNISRHIRKAIDSRADYICLIERLYRANLMAREYYLERTETAAAQLQRHRASLNRLGEIGRY